MPDYNTISQNNIEIDRHKQSDDDSTTTHIIK